MACISSLTKATIAAIKLTSTHTGTDSHEHQEAAGTAQQRGTAEPGNSMSQAIPCARQFHVLGWPVPSGLHAKITNQLGNPGHTLHKPLPLRENEGGMVKSGYV